MQKVSLKAPVVQIPQDKGQNCVVAEVRWIGGRTNRVSRLIVRLKTWGQIPGVSVCRTILPLNLSR